MFEYFPGNYVWNLGVVATLNSGGLIDEVDRACRPIRDACRPGRRTPGTADFMRAWPRSPTSSSAQADEAEKAGHLRTAGQKYFRATVYLAQAERMQSATPTRTGSPVPAQLELAQKSFELSDPRDHPGRDPVRGHRAAGLLQRRPAPPTAARRR